MVFIKGHAMPWFYFCDKCKKILFKVDGGSRVDCAICGEKGKLPEDIKICSSCSYDTNMCMRCGAPIEIEDDYENMVRKAFEAKVKPRKRKRKSKGGAK